MNTQQFIRLAAIGVLIIISLLILKNNISNRNIVSEYQIRLKEQERNYLLKYVEVEKLERELENCQSKNK